MRPELLLCLVAAAGCTDGDAAAGRAIYRSGVDARGHVVAARVAGVPLEGAGAACARCHGARGEGRKEGGIAAPPLVRHALADYDTDALGRALNDGFGRHGVLHATMPRYTFTRAQVEDLHAYLQVVDRDREPGVLDDAIRIGAVLPARSVERRQVAAALDAFLASEGRIFHRRLELVVAEHAVGLEDETLALVASAGMQLPEGVPVIEIPAPGSSGQALAAARTLAEALRRAGDNPTRAALRDAMELSAHSSSGSTGTLPPGG